MSANGWRRRSECGKQSKPKIIYNNTNSIAIHCVCKMIRFLSQIWGRKMVYDLQCFICAPLHFRCNATTLNALVLGHKHYVGRIRGILHALWMMTENTQALEDANWKLLAKYPHAHTNMKCLTEKKNGCNRIIISERQTRMKICNSYPRNVGVAHQIAHFIEIISLLRLQTKTTPSY